MTICIAGKNFIATEIAKIVKENYPALHLIGICNQNDLGKNEWQPSFKLFCQKNNIPLVTLENIYAISDLIFLSLEFDKIIKPEKFSSNRLYNIHFSALPAYKGMFTSVMPILNGELETGVTLHYIDSGIDTGDIIAQQVFEIDTNDNAENLYHKYLNHGIDLIKANLTKLIQQNDIASKKQSAIKSSYFPKYEIDFKNIKINLKKTAWEIHNQVRAFSFRPYQLPTVENIPVFRSEILSAKKENTQVGAILARDEWGFTVNAIDYQVRILKDKAKELYEVAKTGNLNEFDRLKENGFPTNIKLQNGWDALIVACYHNQFEFAKRLVESGWNVNSKNYKGTTCIMYAMTAASRDHETKLLSFLLAQNADLTAKDDQGKDIFEYANEYKNKMVIELLNNFK